MNLATLPGVTSSLLPDALARRLHPVADSGLPGAFLALAVLVALAVVGVPDLWRRLRIVVTLVHELGHAVVGILVGRRFTGFVVRGDMSGHAVTVGRPRGLGRVATTWAGYPMPALVGLLMVWAGHSGYAALLLFAVLSALLLALVFVRSMGTFAVVVTGGVGVAAVWWWRVDALQTWAVIAAGVVLILGAWHHLGSVATARRRNASSDPSVLSGLTGIPAVVWVGTYVGCLALATWAASRLLFALPWCPSNFC